MSEPHVVIVTPVQTPILKVGIPGPPGPSNIRYHHNFSYGDATPYQLITVLAGKTFYTLEVNITTAFLSNATTISIGDEQNHERLMAATHIIPTEQGCFIVVTEYVYEQDTPIYLYISIGEDETQGQGSLSIDRQV